MKITIPDENKTNESAHMEDTEQHYQANHHIHND
jgi:hypothetical protein